MASKAKEPTHFVVGTDNMNGQTADIFTERYLAEKQVYNLLMDGFADNEIFWIEGVKKRITASTRIEVEGVTFT